MSPETAFVVAIPWSAAELGQFRFEVYSALGDASHVRCGPNVCTAIPTGTWWGCDNFNRPEFTLLAVRAAFPTVEALEFDAPPSTWLCGRLPDTIELRRTIDLDTLELRSRLSAAARELDRLTGARLVTVTEALSAARHPGPWWAPRSSR